MTAHQQSEGALRRALAAAQAQIADLESQLQALNDHGSRSVTFKMKRDPRITPVGRVIRKLSIDELPQLWLVLTGAAVLVSLAGFSPLGILGIASIVISGIYLLDIRPRIQEITGQR